MAQYTREERAKIFTDILREELQMALGCTEPIAIAYCAAYAADLLGKRPERMNVNCSGNIIKNVKAVTVPQTGGMVGIEAAALAGAIGGDAKLEMEVLSNVTDEHRAELKKAMDAKIVTVNLLDTEHTLHIVVEMFAGEDSVSVEIVDAHTQIGTVVKNGKVLHEIELAVAEDNLAQREALSVESIVEFANNADLSTLSDILENQVKCNLAISEEGLNTIWGAAVGQILMGRKDDLYLRLSAAAAAGSDARMNGCAMPVVINSGSGNQGITVAVPIALYAQEKGYSHETMLRGLIVGNLIGIHQKTTIGKLSAFCGAVSAGAGAVCGIAYMDGASVEVISNTLINTVACTGGMVCDGAKSSCAAKIAASINAGFVGYELAKAGRRFLNGEGIVKEDVEATVKSVGRMAAVGMRSTDTEILKIMIDQ